MCFFSLEGFTVEVIVFHFNINSIRFISHIFLYPFPFSSYSISNVRTSPSTSTLLRPGSFYGYCLWMILFLWRSATNYPASLWTSRPVVRDANCVDDWSLLLCTWSWWKDPWKAEKIIGLSQPSAEHCHANPPRAKPRSVHLDVRRLYWFGWIIHGCKWMKP